MKAYWQHAELADLIKSIAPEGTVSDDKAWQKALSAIDAQHQYLQALLGHLDRLAHETFWRRCYRRAYENIIKKEDE